MTAERVELAAQRATAVSAQPTVAPRADEMRTRLQTLTDLQKRGLVKPYFNVIFSTGKIAPAFVELFQLTAAEQESLQSAVTKTREEVEQLALAHAVVRRPSDNQLVIDVSPTADGTSLADGLLDEFGRVLGPERDGAFKTLGIKQFEQAFNQFGVEARTVALTRTTGSDTTKFYDLEDRHKTAANGVTSQFSKGKKLEDLNGQLGGIGKLIPADF